MGWSELIVANDDVLPTDCSQSLSLSNPSVDLKSQLVIYLLCSK